jgi:hypothetical protein
MTKRIPNAKKGRPFLPPGEARVLLPAQRIERVTLTEINALAPSHRGKGRVIDAAIRAYKQYRKMAGYR